MRFSQRPPTRLSSTCRSKGPFSLGKGHQSPLPVSHTKHFSPLTIPRVISLRDKDDIFATGSVYSYVGQMCLSQAALCYLLEPRTNDTPHTHVSRRHISYSTLILLTGTHPHYCICRSSKTFKIGVSFSVSTYSDWNIK